MLWSRGTWDGGALCLGSWTLEVPGGGDSILSLHPTSCLRQMTCFSLPPLCTVGLMACRSQKAHPREVGKCSRADHLHTRQPGPLVKGPFLIRVGRRLQFCSYNKPRGCWHNRGAGLPPGVHSPALSTLVFPGDSSLPPPTHTSWLPGGTEPLGVACAQARPSNMWPSPDLVEPLLWQNHQQILAEDRQPCSWF